jgi:hypothetical protein
MNVFGKELAMKEKATYIPGIYKNAWKESPTNKLACMLMRDSEIRKDNCEIEFEDRKDEFFRRRSKDPHYIPPFKLHCIYKGRRITISIAWGDFHRSCYAKRPAKKQAFVMYGGFYGDHLHKSTVYYERVVEPVKKQLEIEKTGVDIDIQNEMERTQKLDRMKKIVLSTLEDLPPEENVRIAGHQIEIRLSPQMRITLDLKNSAFNEQFLTELEDNSLKLSFSTTRIYGDLQPASVKAILNGLKTTDV